MSIIWRRLGLLETFWQKKEGIISKERKFCVKTLRKFKYPILTQPEYPQRVIYSLVVGPSNYLILDRTDYIPAMLKTDWLPPSDY